MAQVQPYSYQTIINQIQLMALNDPTPPAVGTQEYQTYTQMISNYAIPQWEATRNVLWNELWNDVSDYATIVVDQPDILLPDDFKFIGGGFIRLVYPNSTSEAPQIRSFPVKKIEELELNPLYNQPEFYVYGNIQTGFYLKLGWTPQIGAAEIGATINFRYYSYATNIQFAVNSSNAILNPTDVPQMSDPMFIVYSVAAMVNANNFNMQLYQVQSDLANSSLNAMVEANEMASNFMDDYIKDIDGLTDTGRHYKSKYFSGYWTGNYGP